MHRYGFSGVLKMQTLVLLNLQLMDVSAQTVLSVRNEYRWPEHV